MLCQVSIEWGVARRRHWSVLRGGGHLVVWGEGVCVEVRRKRMWCGDPKWCKGSACNRHTHTHQSVIVRPLRIIDPYPYEL
jgi:hypothetical protein